MGVGVFPVFNPNIPEAVFDSDGKVLAVEFGALEAVSIDIGVRPFSSFGDNRPVPDDFDGDPDDLKEELGEFDGWFAPSDGIAVFSALAAQIRENSGVSRAFRDSDHVVGELECLISSLKIADSKNALFHLEMW